MSMNRKELIWAFALAAGAVPMVVRSQKLLADAGRRPAKPFSGSEEAWKGLVALDLDLVYIVTPWRWHTPMAVHAMENARPAWHRGCRPGQASATQCK
ncbi:MAG: hypothetical protein U9P12_00360 [Verrucomicrobiota bacterium]|nr:hypothetical protein [Verrucomicrobiota bacterium]